MPRTQFTVLSSSNRTNFQGTRGPFTIPASASQINSVRMYVDSTTNQGVHTYTDPNMHLNMTAQHSDDGVNWQDDFAFTSDGGAVDRNGNPVDPEATVYYGEGQRPIPGTFERFVITQVGTFRFGIFAEVDYI